MVLLVINISFFSGFLTNCLLMAECFGFLGNCFPENVVLIELLLGWDQYYTLILCSWVRRAPLLPSLTLNSRKNNTPLLLPSLICSSLLHCGRIQACGWTLSSQDNTSQRKPFWPPALQPPGPLVEEGTPACPPTDPTDLSLWGWHLEIYLLINL